MTAMNTMPSRHEYTMAMQNPAVHLRDPDLVDGYTIPNESGWPAVCSGQFASVYRVSSNGQDYAVRCFVVDDPDRRQRYAALSDHLGANRPECITAFTYLDQEILVSGMRYPVVKMDWVEGMALDEFVEAQRNNAGALRNLAAKWLETMENLRSANIAHNDLQHGNVIISPQGTINLVDYDGVYLPSFEGSPSPEIGHQNYQHPGRTDQHYDENSDNFPALVIYLSLKAVAVAPTLRCRYHRKDRLLFTKEDLARPGGTCLWKALADIPDEEVKHLTEQLAVYCGRSVSKVPPLASIVKPTRPASLRLKDSERHGIQSTPSGKVSPSREPSLSASAPSTTGSSIVPPEKLSASAESANRRPATTAGNASVARGSPAAVKNPVATPACGITKITRQGDACITALCILSLLAVPGAGAGALYFLLGHLTLILTIYLTVATSSLALYFCYLDPQRPGLNVLRRAVSACRRNKRWRQIALEVVVGLVGVAAVGFVVNFIMTNIGAVLLALLAIGLIWGFLYLLGVGRY